MTGLSALTLLMAYRKAAYSEAMLINTSRDMCSGRRGEGVIREAQRRARQQSRFEAALIEKLQQRPSCATCRWAREQNDYEKRRDGYVWCKEVCAFVDPEQSDGVCLWEAK